MAVREVLKYSEIEKITLVDLDPHVVELFRGNDQLRRLNNNALNSERVRVVHEDAFTWLRNNNMLYDFIIIDLPDPTSFSLGKLYSNYFYAYVKKAMHDDSLLVVQATSPLIARRSFWTVHKTLQSVGFKTKPYHVYVPSFTEWGYILASKSPIHDQEELPNDLRFISTEEIKKMYQFSKDMMMVDTGIQTLSTQTLVSEYAREWSSSMSQ